MEKKQKKNSGFPDASELNLPKTATTKKGKVKKAKHDEFDGEPVFEEPADLSSFERPETVKLNEIGESIEGLYEGLQPVSFNSGGMGALLLLRQRNGSLLGINAGYDIRRFLLESGFGDMIGEYIRITLSSLINTGMPAPMKQYSFQYRKNLQLQGGNMTAKQLQASTLLLTDGEKIVHDAKTSKHKEKWEN